MRKKGTQYPTIENLPPRSLPVSVYADENNISVAYVYIRYKRYENGKTSDPCYRIRCFMGMNYVIPS